MLEKVKTTMCSTKAKVVGAVATVGTVMMPVMAFATEDAGVTTAMTTAFTAVKTDFMAVVAVIGPIALAIVGIKLVWRWGIGFFKGLAK